MNRFLITILFASILAPAAARAETAAALIDRGVRLREQGKDQEALAVFEEAYEKKKSGRALAQIALAEQALGRWVDAETHLKAALATKERWIEKRKKPLAGALETIREHLGSLEVLGGPEGAKVLLNGKAVGTLPLDGAVRVVAGSVVVDVVKEGYRPISRTTEVRPGGLGRETIELVPELAAAPPSSPPPAPPPPAAPPPPPAAPPPPAVTAKTTPPSSDSDLSLWGWVAAGGAVAGVGTGIAGVVLRAQRVNAYNDDSVCLAGGRTRDENCKDELDAANTFQAVGIAGLVVGGALAATSVLLFVLDGGEEVTVSLGPGDIGAGIGARF